MGQYVKFEAKKLFKTLNVLEQSQLKYSGGRALRKLGFEMKKNVIPRQMKANFRIGEQAAPYTLNSIRYGIVDNNKLELTVNEAEGKGNAPAKYLFPPMVSGGAAYTTRFTKALRAQNYISDKTWAVPNTDQIGLGKRDGNAKIELAYSDFEDINLTATGGGTNSVQSSPLGGGVLTPPLCWISIVFFPHL